MTPSLQDLTGHLLLRLTQVNRSLGRESPEPVDAQVRFADVLDSMALVEYLALLAEDFGVPADDVEGAVGRRFGAVAELARSLERKGFCIRDLASAPATPDPQQRRAPGTSGGATGCWLAATVVRLPDTIQSAAYINQALQRPHGWLETRAGIWSRRVWADQDPLAAAAAAGRDCLVQAELTPGAVGMLLVTGEAPPLPVGLAAALHHRLGLRPDAGALEVGGACTGFLASLRLAQAMLRRSGPVLILAVEAPSRWLALQPGAAGEAAALFGDAAGAALLAERRLGRDAVPLEEIILGADGGAGRLAQVEWHAGGWPVLHLEGTALAGRALSSLAQVSRSLLGRHGLVLAQLEGIVAHGGNGRLPALLARQLGLPPERIWSETQATGNLGSVSLPAAWVARHPTPTDPVAWVAVGAGLTWAAGLTGLSWDCLPSTAHR